MRWVRSSYYPSTASVMVILLEEAESKLRDNPGDEQTKARVAYLRHKVRGTRYWGEDARGEIDRNAILDDETKKTAYRVQSKQYKHPYVGHYDSSKYKQEMIDYKNGKRKSRPNGRTWCKIQTTLKEGESRSEWELLSDWYDITSNDLEEKVESNAIWARFRRYVKITQKYKSPHPIFNIVSIVVAEPKYSMESPIPS